MSLNQTTNSIAKEFSVVIADDDDITREMLRGLLRAAGFHVIGEASDGARALDMYQKLKPQILCLDIEMPTMNGIETLKAVRKADTKTIVIMITGAATGDNVRAAIAEKASGIIVKPFNTAKIITEIERAIVRQQAAIESAATANK